MFPIEPLPRAPSEADLAQLAALLVDAVERLYRATGWSCAGTIPRFALDPDGTPCDGVIFYKELGA
jgi:hypothetical protein